MEMVITVRVMALGTNLHMVVGMEDMDLDMISLLEVLDNKHMVVVVEAVVVEVDQEEEVAIDTDRINMVSIMAV